MQKHRTIQALMYLSLGLLGQSCERKTSPVVPITQIPLAEVMPTFASYFPSASQKSLGYRMQLSEGPTPTLSEPVVNVLSSQAISPTAEVGLSMTVSMGHSLTPENPNDSVTFEPTASLTFPEKNALSLVGAIDRPLNPYENISIPKTTLTYSHPVFTKWIKVQLRAYSTLLELDRWGADGVMIRNGVAVGASSEVLPGLSLLLRVGPYFQVNEYIQRTNGATLPQYGFSERMGVTYKPSRLSFDLMLITDQKFVSVWNNDYYTYESISYSFSASMTAGLSHELSTGLVDKSTGFYRPIRVFDGRDSRVSFFMEFII